MEAIIEWTRSAEEVFAFPRGTVKTYYTNETVYTCATNKNYTDLGIVYTFPVDVKGSTIVCTPYYSTWEWWNGSTYITVRSGQYTRDITNTTKALPEYMDGNSAILLWMEGNNVMGQITSQYRITASMKFELTW